MSSIFRRNKVEEKTVINNIIQKKTINQIDYQTAEFKVPQSSTTSYRYSVPLPINSVLKAVNVRMDTDASSTADCIEAHLFLQANQNTASNIRVFQTLDKGSLCESGQGDNFYSLKTLGGLYDIAIQKEGIELALIVYNASTTTHTIKIHWQIENLEGGI